MLIKLSEEQREELERKIFEASLPPLADELCRVDLGDKRLEARHRQVVEAAIRAPNKSFVEMCSSEAELKGMYRFFSHGAAKPERLWEPHVEATCERADELRRVLALHDTSGISQGGSKRRGLGRLNDGGSGYYLHFSLAVSADGLRVPLGGLHYETLVRPDPPDEERKEKNWKDKAPDRESLRWWRGVERCAELFEGSGTELIHVMDREADDYELLAKMLQAQQRFVVRLKYDRLLSVSKEARASGAPRKVHEALSQASVEVQRTVYLSPRKKDRSTEKRKTYPAREGRMATLCASAMRVELLRPKDAAKADPQLPRSIELNIVRVWEINAPAGTVPVEWYLLSTEPIDTFEQIEQIIDFYRARWVIEEFFKALKSGCSIEKRQLESSGALFTALSVFLPIAWRLLLLRSLPHIAPNAPASAVLSETQIEILRRARPKFQLPQIPTISEAFPALASLGGHLKHNGDPGWSVLGRGLEKLLLLEEGWRLARYGDVSNQ